MLSAVESWELKVEGGENDDASRVVSQKSPECFPSVFRAILRPWNYGVGRAYLQEEGVIFAVGDEGRSTRRGT